MALADVVHEAQEPCADVLWRPPAAGAARGAVDEATTRALGARLAGLVRRAAAGLADDGFRDDAVSFTAYLNVRYAAPRVRSRVCVCVWGGGGCGGQRCAQVRGY